MSFGLFMTLRTVSTYILIIGALFFLIVFAYFEFIAHYEGKKRRQILYRKPFKRSFLSGLIIITLGLCSSFLFYAFTPLADSSKYKDVFRFPPEKIEGGELSRGNFLVKSTNGFIQSEEIQFKESKYDIKIEALGNEVLGESAHLKVFLGDELVMDFFTTPDWEERSIEYFSQKKETKRIRIQYVNDFVDHARRLDRNAFIRSIIITKEHDIPQKREILLLLALSKIAYLGIPH
jgi:hypothetical protein